MLYQCTNLFCENRDPSENPGYCTHCYAPMALINAATAPAAKRPRLEGSVCDQCRRKPVCFIGGLCEICLEQITNFTFSPSPPPLGAPLTASGSTSPPPVSMAAQRPAVPPLPQTTTYHDRLGRAHQCIKCKTLNVYFCEDCFKKCVVCLKLDPSDETIFLSTLNGVVAKDSSHWSIDGIIEKLRHLTHKDFYWIFLASLYLSDQTISQKLWEKYQSSHIEKYLESVGIVTKRRTCYELLQIGLFVGKHALIKTIMLNHHDYVEQLLAGITPDSQAACYNLLRQIMHQDPNDTNDESCKLLNILWETDYIKKIYTYLNRNNINTHEFRYQVFLLMLNNPKFHHLRPEIWNKDGSEKIFKFLLNGSLDERNEKIMAIITSKLIYCSDWNTFILQEMEKHKLLSLVMGNQVASEQIGYTKFTENLTQFCDAIINAIPIASTATVLSPYITRIFSVVPAYYRQQLKTYTQQLSRSTSSASQRLHIRELQQAAEGSHVEPGAASTHISPQPPVSAAQRPAVPPLPQHTTPHAIAPLTTPASMAATAASPPRNTAAAVHAAMQPSPTGSVCYRCLNNPVTFDGVSCDTCLEQITNFTFAPSPDFAPSPPPLGAPLTASAPASPVSMAAQRPTVSPLPDLVPLSLPIGASLTASGSASPPPVSMAAQQPAVSPLPQTTTYHERLGRRHQCIKCKKLNVYFCENCFDKCMPGGKLKSGEKTLILSTLNGNIPTYDSLRSIIEVINKFGNISTQECYWIFLASLYLSDQTISQQLWLKHHNTQIKNYLRSLRQPQKTKVYYEWLLISIISDRKALLDTMMSKDKSLIIKKFLERQEPESEAACYTLLHHTMQLRPGNANKALSDLLDILWGPACIANTDKYLRQKNINIYEFRYQYFLSILNNPMLHSLISKILDNNGREQILKFLSDGNLQDRNERIMAIITSKLIYCSDWNTFILQEMEKHKLLSLVMGNQVASEQIGYTKFTENLTQFCDAIINAIPIASAATVLSPYITRIFSVVPAYYRQQLKTYTQQLSRSTSSASQRLHIRELQQAAEGRWSR